MKRCGKIWEAVRGCLFWPLAFIPFYFRPFPRCFGCSLLITSLPSYFKFVPFFHPCPMPLFRSFHVLPCKLLREPSFTFLSSNQLAKPQGTANYSEEDRSRSKHMRIYTLHSQHVCCYSPPCQLSAEISYLSDLSLPAFPLTQGRSSLVLQGRRNKGGRTNEICQCLTKTAPTYHTRHRNSI